MATPAWSAEPCSNHHPRENDMRLAMILALTSISSAALAGIEPPPSIPEPSVLALLGIGAVAGLIAARKRK